jgi:hypothetical protein
MANVLHTSEIIGYVEHIEAAKPQLAAEITGYVEYTEPMVEGLGAIIGYVEYEGNAAGSFTPDIPTLGEVIGYVEYSDLGFENLGAIIGYVEYIEPGAGTKNAGEIIAYVEYQLNALVLLNTGIISTASPQLDVLPGAVTISLDEGIIVISGPLADLLPGAVTILLDAGIVVMSGPQAIIISILPSSGLGYRRPNFGIGLKGVGL